MTSKPPLRPVSSDKNILKWLFPGLQDDFEQNKLTILHYPSGDLSLSYDHKIRHLSVNGKESDAEKMANELVSLISDFSSLSERYLAFTFNHLKIGESDFFMENHIEEPLIFKKLTYGEVFDLLENRIARPFAYRFNNHWLYLEHEILLREYSNNIFRMVYKIERKP